MSDAGKEYILRFGGEDATGPAFDEIIARAKEAGAKISTQLNKGMGGGGKPEWMESLKDQFGRESAFGGLGEMLRGGGALIGITAATEAIKGLAEGAEKVKQDFYDSDKNAADMAQDLMQSIPVLGSIEQAGAAINELFTGEQEALKRAKDDAAELDKELTVHKQLIKEGAAYYHDTEETIKRIKAHTAEIGMPVFEKGQAETSSAGSDKKDAPDTALKQQIEKLQNDAKPAIEQLRQKIRDQQNRIAQGFMVASTSMDPDGPATMVEDEQAKQEALNHLAQLEARKSNLEKNRNHQIDLAKTGTANEESVIDADTKKQLAQNQKIHDQQMHDDARQAAIEHTASIAEQGAAEMQLRGHFLDANIAQIHAAAEKEVAELRLSADKKQDDLKKGSKEWLAVEADYAQKSADIQASAKDKEAEARKTDMQWELEQKRQHAQEMSDGEMDLRQKILKATGHGYEAEHEMAEKEHNDRLAKIKADAQAEINAHGEHRGEIEKRAKESTDAENKRYDADSLMQRIDIMKETPAVNMTASSAGGGVGLDANAMGGLMAPGVAQLNSQLDHDNKVAAMQGQLNTMMPGKDTSHSSSPDVVAALNAILAYLQQPIKVKAHMKNN